MPIHSDIRVVIRVFYSNNVLCLYANCCTKFEYGSVEADDILEQIKSVELKFSERHIIDLQGILKSKYARGQFRSYSYAVLRTNIPYSQVFTGEF